MRCLPVILAVCCTFPGWATSLPAQSPLRKTFVSIVGNQFYINGAPTYPGREWNGHKIEGLLFNTRLVQGIFDDLNPDTVARWAYPDSGNWDPERNTREFVAAMPEWRRHGMLAFTVNLQGGSPQGYSREQPWHNSAFTPDGSLRPAYMNRLELILDRADELGMAVILGYFYFGQDERLNDEAAVIRATDNATRWVLSRGYRHVLVEICNETNDQSYDHEILRTDRVHELLDFVRGTTVGGRRLLAGVSYWGNVVPKENVVRNSDFILLHGNGVNTPQGIVSLVNATRAVQGYRDQPIVFNEDDHFDFDQPMNNLVAAISEYASWGYFDYRMEGEGFDEGFQSVPANWRISSDRKRGFFGLLSQITGIDGLDTHTAGSFRPITVSAPRGRVVIRRGRYRNWDDAVFMNNGQAEVIIVPQIGRVMQFRFVGHEGPFRESDTADSPGPPRHGGDSTQPIVQSSRSTAANGGGHSIGESRVSPMTVTIQPDNVVLTSPIEPVNGFQIRRTVKLLPDRAELLINTSLENVEGATATVAIRGLTQLKASAGVFVAVPDPTLFPAGHHVLSTDHRDALQFSDGLLALPRSTEPSVRVGTDAHTLLWLGYDTMLRVESPRQRSARYPANNSNTAVTIHPEPDAPVDFEWFSPQVTLRRGDGVQTETRYVLLPRTHPDAETNARAVLNRPLQ